LENPIRQKQLNNFSESSHGDPPPPIRELSGERTSARINSRFGDFLPPKVTGSKVPGQIMGGALFSQQILPISHFYFALILSPESSRIGEGGLAEQTF
jgi:hypothetical protein